MTTARRSTQGPLEGRPGPPVRRAPLTIPQPGCMPYTTRSIRVWPEGAGPAGCGVLLRGRLLRDSNYPAGRNSILRRTIAAVLATGVLGVTPAGAAAAGHRTEGTRADPPQRTHPATGPSVDVPYFVHDRRSAGGVHHEHRRSSAVHPGRSGPLLLNPGQCVRQHPRPRPQPLRVACSQTGAFTDAGDFSHTRALSPAGPRQHPQLRQRDRIQGPVRGRYVLPVRGDSGSLFRPRGVL
jgi:hypothetical protein